MLLAILPEITVRDHYHWLPTPPTLWLCYLAMAARGRDKPKNLKRLGCTK